MNNLLDLAARCEAAEGPDRALDGVAHILTNPEKPWIVGHEPGRFPRKAIRGTLLEYLEWATGLCDEPEKAKRADVAVSIGAPAYTASLDAALTLVPEGWAYIDFRRFVDGTVGCDMEVIGVKLNTIEACAATPALALTAAALRARASQGDAS